MCSSDLTALDEAGKKFTEARTPFDRAQAKLEVDKRRQELEELNGQLTKLITDKQEQDAIQKQKSDESLLRAGEQKLGLQEVGEGNAEPTVTTGEEAVTPKVEEKEVEKPTQEQMLDDINKGNTVTFTYTNEDRKSTRLNSSH